MGDQTLADLQLRCKPNAEVVLGTLEDLTLKVRIEKGDLLEVDCSCDSAYMLEAMDTVGRKVRAVFWWIPAEQIIFLFMDNAGGHGTNKAVEQYTQDLREKYKIEIVHQIPRSPYTNLLDLGVWCSLQS